VSVYICIISPKRRYRYWNAEETMKTGKTDAVMHTLYRKKSRFTILPMSTIPVKRNASDVCLVSRERNGSIFVIEGTQRIYFWYGRNARDVHMSGLVETLRMCA
jgi:hypothetical protein